ncbi:MAG: hypothetical protein EA379_06175 [Phycisphaerales bacterium]|nr:MAG: hypothetical protein EA379_06175 [Phycisphaerales bacterium]
MRLLSVSIMSAAIAGAAAAGPITQTVPLSAENAAGNSTFLGPLANSQRTYQLLVHESQLTNLVGLRLTGLSWRLPTAATIDWPAAIVEYANYDIYISDSVNPADRSLTFADNVVGTQTQVRSGALTIDENSYTSGSSPNAFGPTIDFGTEYLYTGGNLLVEIRHTGFTGTSRSVDAYSTSAATGYGSLFSAAWTGNYEGVQGTQGNFSIFQFNAIPTPGAAALLGMGALVAARRRR